MHSICRISLGISIPSLVFLCSCATHAPAPESTVDTPEQWKAPQANTASLDKDSLAIWWQNFNDPVLNQLITDALVGSPDVRIALSKVAQSRAQRGVEKSALFPSLSAGVSASDRYERNRPARSSTTTDNYQASLDASWEIDLFGKQQLLVEAATADLLETQENYYAAQITLVSEVADAYISLRSYENQLAIVQKNLETLETTTQIAQWRQEAGISDSLATQQSLSTLEQAKAAIPSLQQSIAESRNRLSLLSGRTPGSLDELLSAQKPIPTPPSNIAVGIPAETLRQRPDVRAAEYAIIAAVARNKSARRERLPSLTLTGSIGVEALRIGDLFSPQTIFANVMGGLTAPIFEGGRITQNIAIQDELQKQAYIQYESTVLTALSEVENALVAVQRNTERIASLQKAADAAIKATDMATYQYKSGQVDILTVLDTQRTQLNLEEQLVSAVANQTSAYVQLYKALGGGWSPNQDSSK